LKPFTRRGHAHGDHLARVEVGVADGVVLIFGPGLLLLQVLHTAVELPDAADCKMIETGVDCMRIRVTSTGLPDGIFSNQKSQFG
jgi:hypothetical protein